jgi:predicted  nucleic acid-binding Zn-ribbon protein
VNTVGGNIVEMRLAERGILLAGKIWLREIRKLSVGGHQTSILSTNYTSTAAEIASTMFARWSQENFFKYMRENYSLDRLIDYNTSTVSDTTKVVNPQHRSMTSEIKKKTTILNRALAHFGSVNIEGEINPQKVSAYQQEKADLQEKIVFYQAEIEKLKKDKKGIPSHISFSELPKEQQFKQLSTGSKHFIDTVKMIAYRAETSMVQVLREVSSRKDEARSLVKAVYDTEVDLVPDEKKNTLTIFLHHLANHSASESVQHLCKEMNKTETIFPGTNLRLIYKMGSALNPRS